MLFATFILIVPGARRKQISLQNAIYLALTMWALSLLVAWVCIRSRHKRTQGSDRDITTYTDYSDAVHHETESRGEETIGS